MRTVAFTVPGVPVGYDRASARLMFTPTEVKRFRALVVLAFQRAAPDHQPTTGKIGIHVRAFGSKGDADNVIKEVMDALKGVAYRDDCQVVREILEFPTRELGPAGGVKKPKDDAPRLECWVQFIAAAPPVRKAKRRRAKRAA